MEIFNIGPMELLLILVLVLIVFGPDKIPDIGRSLGSAIAKFRSASREITNDLNLEDLNPSTIVDALAAQGTDGEAAKAATESGPAGDSTSETPISPTTVSGESALPAGDSIAGAESTSVTPASPATVSVESASLTGDSIPAGTPTHEAMATPRPKPKPTPTIKWVLPPRPAKVDQIAPSSETATRDETVQTIPGEQPQTSAIAEGRQPHG